MVTFILLNRLGLLAAACADCWQQGVGVPYVKASIKRVFLLHQNGKSESSSNCCFLITVTFCVLCESCWPSCFATADKLNA